MSYTDRSYSDRGYNDRYDDRYYRQYPVQQSRTDNYRSQNSNDRYRSERPVEQNRSSQPQRITLGREYIAQIKSGEKTIEGRVNTTMFQNLRVGDNVVFYENRNPDNEVKCSIIAKRKYTSFREMLTQEGVAKCLPKVKTLEEAVGIYDKIPGYNEKVKQFGALAIEIELYNKPALPKVTPREKEKTVRREETELKRTRESEDERAQTSEHVTKKTRHSNDKR